MSRHTFILFFYFFSTFCVFAQVETPDSTSINKELTGGLQRVKISDSGLETNLIYGATDSQNYDKVEGLWHLYGNAFVTYEDKELKADYIILDHDNNIAEAKWQKERPNSSRPTFTEGGKTYEYNHLKYNFEKKKGIIYDTKFSEGEFYILANKTKYVGAGSDKFSDDDVVYNQGATITTCNHEHPHFGFRSRRMKVVKDKVAVLGPSNLRLGGVATPIWLPFGFFPLVEGKSSGFIFPQDYEFNSRNLGFGLRGMGWYFPISDYFHMQLTGDIYTRGSYSLYMNSNYRKRYKYNGRINLSFSDRRVDGEVDNQVRVISDKGFTIDIRHDQDSKAHPFVTVGGNINIVGNNNQNRINNDAVNVLTNVYSSNFYYRHSMPNTPFSFSLGLNHNQNTRTNIVNITLPDIALLMNNIYPFKRKNKGSNKEKWYEKISFDYDVKFKSLVTTTDTTLFTPETLENLKTGLSQKANTNFSTRIFKNFNISPRASYEELTVLNTIERNINRIYDRTDTSFVEINGIIDTTITEVFKDTVVTNTLRGLDSYRTFSAGVGVSTQLFATALFSKGWLRGIRQTIKPDLSYNFAPDTRSVYQDSLYYSDSERTPLTYSRFDNGPFGNARITDLTSQLNFSVNGVLEIKYWSKKDSIEKKFKIFDNIRANVNYNFARDTLQWSRPSLSTTTRLFKGMTQLTSSWTFDPYLKENNRTLKETVWSDRKKLARLERGTIRLTNKLTFKKIISWLAGKKDDDENSRNQSGDQDLTNDRSEVIPGGRPPVDEFEEKPPTNKRPLTSFSEIFQNITLDYNLTYEYVAGKNGEVSSRISTNSIGVSGNIPLTENWSIGIGNLGYSFAGRRKGLTYTDINFTRKLHCWNMRFSWNPNRETYTFFIGVNSSNLSFLKYNYGQNNLDNPFGGI